MTTWSGHFTSRYIYTEDLGAGLEEIFLHLYAQQHYSQYQKVEANQVSMDRWVDKHNVVYIDIWRNITQP